MMVGFFDFRSSVASASKPAGSGRVDRHKLSGVDASTAVSCSMTSIGSDTNTGPCGASVATLNARRMIGAISSARSICTLDLHAPLRHWRCHRNEVVAEQWILESHSGVLLTGGHDRR